MSTNNLAARAAVLPCVRAVASNQLGVYLDGNLITINADSLTPDMVEALEQLQDLQDKLQRLLKDAA